MPSARRIPSRNRRRRSADEQQSDSQVTGDLGTASALETALTHDAAILDWEGPRESSGEAPSPAEDFPQTDVVPATPSVDTVDAPVGDRPATGESAVGVWDVDRRLVVPLLAAIATSALVATRLGEANETDASPAAAPRRLRKSSRRPI